MTPMTTGPRARAQSSRRSSGCATAASHREGCHAASAATVPITLRLIARLQPIVAHLLLAPEGAEACRHSAGTSRRPMMWTSTSPRAASWVKRFTSSPRLQLLQRLRWLAPITIWVIWCCRANAARVSTTSSPRLLPVRADIDDRLAHFCEPPTSRTPFTIPTRDMKRRGGPSSASRHSRGRRMRTSCRRCGRPDHDALSRLPGHLRMVALEIFEELLFGLVGENLRASTQPR